jgi:hypothetical protein
MKTILAMISMALVAVTPARAQVEPTAATANSPPLSTNAAPLNSEVTMFYDSLAPYGEWLWVEPYGWVWSPSGVDVSWRPYTDGSWAYTDCGWTWVSDAPWGWAPYHYGRWFFHEHRGWCWVPDRVWGPAWVSWHFGDAWCGWAPLPPGIGWEARVDWDPFIPAFGWCFVGRGDFLRPHLREHIVLAARNVTLLRETRNVTRFEIRDRRVINNSISAKEIERFTGRPVTQLRIADVNSAAAARGVRGRELRMFRPEPKPGTAVTMQRSMPASRAPATSWEDLRRNEAERARVAAAQQAQHDALERSHQLELRQPPRGLSPGELQQRHQAEHRAFDEQLSRERQVFEHRAPPARQFAMPAAPQRSSPSGHSVAAGRGGRR